MNYSLSRISLEPEKAYLCPDCNKSWAVNDNANPIPSSNYSAKGGGALFEDFKSFPVNLRFVINKRNSIF